MSRDNEWLDIQRVFDKRDEYKLVLCERTQDLDGHWWTDEQILMYVNKPDKAWLVEKLRDVANQLEVMG